MPSTHATREVMLLAGSLIKRPGVVLQSVLIRREDTSMGGLECLSIARRNILFPWAPTHVWAHIL